MKFFLTTAFVFSSLSYSNNQLDSQIQFNQEWERRLKTLNAESSDACADQVACSCLLAGFWAQALSNPALATPVTFCPMAAICASGIAFGVSRASSASREFDIWEKMAKPDVRDALLAKYRISNISEAAAREAYNDNDEKVWSLLKILLIASAGGVACPDLTWCILPFVGASAGDVASSLLSKRHALQDARLRGQNQKQKQD